MTSTNPMNWTELEDDLRRLAAQITNRPDCIVGVVRGGLVPARLLATYLNVKEMYGLTVRKVDTSRQVTTTISDDLNGKKILLVEDMLETGKSLRVAQEYLETKGVIVKTACLYTMPQSEITPDYFLQEIETVPHFPWE